MAIMIPSNIERNDARRHGEYMVYDWLSSEKIPGYCFYSLPQKTHPHKLMGEVDFLYITTKGILAIEVKGGQDIYRDGRNWFSVNRLGVANPISNPFEQARGCMHAVSNYLSEVYGKNSAESKFQLGYCVVFPECIGRCRGADIATEVLFDCTYDLSDFPSFLQTTLTYWGDLEEEKHFGRRSLPLTPNQVMQIVNLMQADFHSVPSMRLELQSVTDKMIQLSEEQLDVVDSMTDNRKVVVQGGAGTGKTLLALEKVRVSLARNKKVLYLCYNKNMAQYAKSNLPESERLTVCTLHSLLTKYVNVNHIGTVRLADLCKQFMKNIPNNKIMTYDVIVVDEAQDIMLTDVWDVVDRLLSKGLDKGEWVVFTDPNQSVFTDNEVYQTSLEYLVELFTPYMMKLNKNWRNTAQIARRTSRLTSTPAAKYMKIDGPKVEKRLFAQKSELIKLVKTDIHSLIMGGVSPSDIVILSPKKLENSYLSSVNECCGLHLVEMNDLAALRKKHLHYATVQSYKGLEANVVLYVDINGFQSLQARKLNYVAMSRAKALLYMYVEDRFENEYNDMMDSNI